MRQNPPGLVSAHRRRLRVARVLQLSDEAWFARRTDAMVRFRPERPGDFGLLGLQGMEPPVFIPDGLDPAAPLIWVAVVDVFRAIALPVSLADGSIRARVRTVPIRSRRLQADMAELFAIAVCRDLLAMADRRHESIAVC